MKKINYTLNNENIIISYHTIPLDLTQPYIEVADDVNIIVGLDKVINGELIKDTEKEYKINRIAELKQLLSNSDYQALKHADGVLTDEEYESMRIQRQLWREEINELEQN